MERPGADSSDLRSAAGVSSLAPGAAKRPKAIEAHELWFRYSKESPELLQGLNLSVDEGEVFALVGANGSGKSTLVSVLSNILTPYRGWVKLGGTKLKNFAPGSLYKNYLGVLPQDPQTLFVGKTLAEDLLDMGTKAASLFSSKANRGQLHQMQRTTIVEGAEALGIADLLDRHPYDLSGGEQQLAALLKVLLLKPRVLLLDEPTKGMDESAKQRVTNLLRALQTEGVTTLFVTHDVEFAAQAADRAGLFFNGQVVSVDQVHSFFSTNNFYTTAASRIGRDWFPKAITKDEVISCVQQSTNL
jgi:energy-coupling factor transport system ATP-binding protein